MAQEDPIKKAIEEFKKRKSEGAEPAGTSILEGINPFSDLPVKKKDVSSGDSALGVETSGAPSALGLNEVDDPFAQENIVPNQIETVSLPLEGQKGIQPILAGRRAQPAEKEAGSRGGYIVNGILEGIGSWAADLADKGFQMPYGFGTYPGPGSPDNPIEAQQQALTNYRENIAPQVRDLLKDKIGAEISAGREKKYDSEFLTSAVKGLAEFAPSMIGSAPIRVASMFLQGTDAAMQSLQEADSEGLLSNSDKTIYSSTVGLVSGMLEHYGFSKILKGKSPLLARAIVNKSLNEAAEAEGGKITGDVLTALIDKNTKGILNSFAKTGKKAVEGFLTEFETGALQEGATIGSEYLLNLAKGEEIFDTSDTDSWEGFLKRVGYAGALEGVGGGLMGTGFGIINSARKSDIVARQKVKEDMQMALEDPATSEQATELIAQELVNIDNDIEAEVETEKQEQQVYTEEEAAQAVELDQRLDKLNDLLNDETVPVSIKESLQQEFDVLRGELESVNNAVADRAKDQAEEDTEVVASSENETNSPNIETNDTQNETGVRGTVGEGKAPVETQPDPGAGGEAPAASGVLQESEEIDTRPVEEVQAGEQDYDARVASVQEYASQNELSLTDDQIESAAAVIDENTTVEDAVRLSVDGGRQFDLEESVRTIEDPSELATMYSNEIQERELGGSIEDAIAAGIGRIPRENFVRGRDRNNITKSIAKTYFARKGEKAVPVDVQAMEINNRFFGGEEMVAPEDIYDFIEKYPDGPGTRTTPSGNTVLRTISQRYKELTGKGINRKIAKKLSESRARDKQRLEENIDAVPDELITFIQENDITPENAEEFRAAIEWIFEDNPNAFDQAKEFVNEQVHGRTEAESPGQDQGDRPEGGTVRDKATVTQPAEGSEEAQSEGSEELAESPEATRLLDKVFDQKNIEPVISFLESLKIKNQGLQSANPIAVIWNSAIDVVEAAIKTGNTLRNAVNLGMEYLRENGASEKDVRDFNRKITGKIHDPESREPTLKSIIREHTDRRAKGKVIMTELAAIKKQMKDWEKGFKAGTQKGVEDARAHYQARESFMRTTRDAIIEIINGAKASAFFKGQQMSQTKALNMLKKVTAARTPAQLLKALNYMENQIAHLEYDNKIYRAQQFIKSAFGQYYPGQSKTVLPFLRIDPENVPSQYLDEYLSALEALKDGSMSDFEGLSRLSNSIRRTIPEEASPEITEEEIQTSDIEKPHRTAWESVKDFLDTFHRKWIDFRKGVPKNVYSMIEQSQGAINMEAGRASRVANQMQKVLKKSPEYATVVDAALRGDAAQLSALPENVAELVVQMRGHVDRLSAQLLADDSVTPSQKINIEYHLGEYLTRSYQLYNNKQWTLDALPPEVYNSAAQYLFRQHYPTVVESNPEASPEELVEIASNLAKADINEIFAKGEDASFFNTSKVGSKDLAILKQRKDIPEEIRALMGEVTDPVANYVQTVHKIAGLSANSKLLNDLKNSQTDILFFDKDSPHRRPEHSVQIAAEGSQVMSPLNGMYTTPELAEALNNQPEQISDIFKAYQKYIGIVKAGKTIGSIVTHFKNVEGNIGFVLMNGHFDGRQMAKSFRAIKEELRSGSDTELNEMVDTLTRLNVIGQSVGAGEVQDLIKQSAYAQEGVTKPVFNMLARLENSKAYKGILKVADFATDLYQAEDNLFKIYGFLNDRKRYSKAMYGKSFEDLSRGEQETVNQYVAEVIKNTYPTYSRVVPAARLGSKYLPIFGNFVSFAAESYRVLGNQTALAYRELTSDNPELRKIGAQRLTGIFAYGSIKAALLKAIGSAGMNGIMGLLFDDEDEKELSANVRRFVAPWSKSSDLIVLDADGGKLRYIDLSSYDPYGNAASVSNALLGGESVGDGIARAAVEFFSPYIDPEITFAMLNSLYNNKDAYGRKIWEEADEPEDKVVKILQYVGKVVEPGTISTIRRVADSDDQTGEAKALVYRTYVLDINQQYRFKVLNAKKRYQSIQTVAWSNEHNSDLSPEEKEEARQDANRKMRELALEMHKDFKAGIALGGNQSSFNSALNNSRMKSRFRYMVKTGDVSHDIFE